MLKNIGGLIFAIMTLSACGQPNSQTNDPLPPDINGVAINSPFINLQNNLLGTTGSLTQEKFLDTTSDLNLRINDNVLFREPYRPTKIEFGDLDQGVLGLTECKYYSNGASNCKIIISNIINPDSTNDPLLKTYKANTFMGVLRHEIGHAFGLGHIKDNDAHVMYPYFKSIHLESINVEKFILDLDNFRKNGEKSGLPTIQTK